MGCSLDIFVDFKMPCDLKWLDASVDTDSALNGVSMIGKHVRSICTYSEYQITKKYHNWNPKLPTSARNFRDRPNTVNRGYSE